MSIHTYLKCKYAYENAGFCILCVDNFKILKIFIKLSKFSMTFTEKRHWRQPPPPTSIRRFPYPSSLYYLLEFSDCNTQIMCLHKRILISHSSQCPNIITSLIPEIYSCPIVVHIPWLLTWITENNPSRIRLPAIFTVVI